MPRTRCQGRCHRTPPRLQRTPRCPATPPSTPSAARRRLLLKTSLPTNADAPLPLGAFGDITGWRVSIAGVITDAAEAIEGAGNSPPANGRYLLVELSATSTGEIIDAQDPSLLTVGLAGGDGLEYSSTGCLAFLDRPASAVGPLSAGETGSWQACIDTSPGALEASSLFVSQLSASREERVHFQLG